MNIILPITKHIKTPKTTQMKYILVILCAFGFVTIFGLIVQIFMPIEDSVFFKDFAPVSSLIGGLVVVDYIEKLKSKNK